MYKKIIIPLEKTQFKCIMYTCSTSKTKNIYEATKDYQAGNQS